MTNTLLTQIDLIQEQSVDAELEVKNKTEG